MIRFLLALTLSCVAAQIETTIDPLTFLEVFGNPDDQPLPNTPDTPATTTTTTTPATPPRKGLEDIIVQPTEGPLISTNADGDTCKCVPYYLCDANRIAIYVNNVTVTGYGELDVRFGEDDKQPICQESVEVCCKEPRETNTEKPKSDPNKLKGCGYRNPKGLGAPVLGNNGETQFGEYPWVVAVLDAKVGTYIGVGVIIHPEVIMTGAHVVHKYGPGGIRIRAGEWDTQTIKEIYDFQQRIVQEIVYHEKFNEYNLVNDIALLRLDEPLKLEEHINMICLPSASDRFDNSKNCVANGWGKSKFGLQGRYAVILKKVEQDMVPNDRCQELLQRTRLGKKFKLHSSFVCAGGEEGKDTCQGDGGAPLACPIGDERYKLTGLVAWGIGCGQKDHPGVHTNVAALRPWTDAHMEAWGYGQKTYSI